MSHSRVSDIKKSQKERLLFRELSQMFLEITLDNSDLRGITLSRVKLSPDKGHCSIYFYTPDGLAKFKELLETLKLYKPSLRKAIGIKIPSRYVPELEFKFDGLYEKQEQFELLMNQIKTEGESE